MFDLTNQTAFAVSRNSFDNNSFININNIKINALKYILRNENGGNRVDINQA
jgi:hypothetical protein